MSKGTVPITGTITTTNDLDTYPTHWDKYAKGGYRTVLTTAQRDAITPERRSEGMQVFVRDVRQLQQLVGGTDNTKWVPILTIDLDNRIIISNPAIGLSKGKLLIGDDTNVAIETQTVNINNLPAGDLSNGGMIKYDSISSLLQIATSGEDYATSAQLKFYADAASSSATSASANAGAAAKESGIATVAASQASASATFASTYSDTASKAAEAASLSALGAAASALLATSSADAASVEALDAGAAATTANDRKIQAETAATNSANSATSSKSYLDALKALGISGLGNFGNVDFNGFRGINLVPGVNPYDIATVSQVTAVGSGALQILNNLSDVASAATSRVNLGVSTTQHSVLIGGSSGEIAAISLGSKGQVLQSGGASADPVYSAATYPLATTANQILYSSSNNTVGGLATVSKAALLTDGSGVPAFVAATGAGAPVLATSPTLITPSLGTPNSGTLTSCTSLPLATGVTGNLPVTNLNSGTSASATTFWRGDGSWATAASGGGTIIAVTGSGNIASSGGTTPNITFTGILPLANGGTNAALTATNGGILYSTASAMAILATANNGVLVTSSGGIPSISSTLPSAVQGNITQLGVQSQAINMNTHQINSLVDPVNAQDAATKNYVDNVAVGLNPSDSVIAATTASLTVTYSNGSAGVGATLTNAGTQAVFLIDGQSPAVGSRVLIKNQSSAFQNGVYTVTNVGSTSTNWVLTRSLDFNTPANMNGTGLIPVINGTINGNTGWLLTSTVSTVGTDSITFTQFGVSFPVSLGNGGTGASLTASNGGIFYSTASGGAILPGTATANQMLQSGTSTAPSWSTATYPVTTTINQILYSAVANKVSGITTVNSAALLTNASGVPAFVAYTGTGLPVLATSPILITPALGVPSNGTLTNCTGLPLTTGVTGNLPVANLNSGTSASSSTFWRGDGTWGAPTGAVTAVTGSGNIASSGGATPNITFTGVLPLTNGGTGASLSAVTFSNRLMTFGATGIPVAAVIASIADRIAVSGIGSSIITVDIAPTYAGQTSLTTLGTITTGAWNGSVIPLANGGTNANLTASNGGIFYSTASGGAILPGTATAGQILTSSASGVPNWASRIAEGTINLNLFIGLNSGSSAALVTPTSCLAIGSSSFSSYTNGGSGIGKTICIGASSGKALITGDYNTFLGESSGSFVTGGNDNSFFGRLSGSNSIATTCTQITLLGSNSNVSANSLTNAIAIGYNASESESNSMTLGNTSLAKIKTTAKIIISTAGSSQGLDLATADSYANFRVIQNTSGVDKDIYIGFQSGVTSNLHLYCNNSKLIYLNSGNVVLGNGAVTTTSTTGYVYIPTVSGTATGAATSYAGSVAMIYDTSANRLAIRSGGVWRSVLLT